MYPQQWNYSGVKAKFSDQLKEAMGNIIDMSNEDVEEILKQHDTSGLDIEEVDFTISRFEKLLTCNLI